MSSCAPYDMLILLKCISPVHLTSLSKNIFLVKIFLKKNATSFHYSMDSWVGVNLIDEAYACVRLLMECSEYAFPLTFR